MDPCIRPVYKSNNLFWGLFKALVSTILATQGAWSDIAKGFNQTHDVLHARIEEVLTSDDTDFWSTVGVDGWYLPATSQWETILNHRLNRIGTLSGDARQKLHIFENAWTLFCNVSKKSYGEMFSECYVRLTGQYSKLIVLIMGKPVQVQPRRPGKTMQSEKSAYRPNALKISDSSLRFLLCFISQSYIVSTYTFMYIYISYVICKYLTFKLLFYQNYCWQILDHQGAFLHHPFGPQCQTRHHQIT